MDEPITWRILAALGARLTEIRTDAGYFTDAGAQVLTEPAQLPDGSAAIVLVASGITTAAPNSSSGISPRQRDLAFVIEATVPASFIDAQLRAHRLLADIEKALAAPLDPDAQLAEIQLVRSIAIESRSIKQRPDGMDATVVEVTGRASYILTQ